MHRVHGAAAGIGGYGRKQGGIRDPEANVRVRLPVAERRYLTESLSRAELLRHPVLGKQYEGEYPFQAGQPDEVRRAYAKAVGIQARDSC